MKAANTVDDYIASFPPEIQSLLQQIRAVIREAAPDATEGIAYQMPAYKLNKKPLVYFAAFPKHIGFYATPTGHEAFAKELSAYKQGKGSVQFPLDGPMPYELIRRITVFRAEENRQGKGKTKS
jgi:uncharacterized protein YdhG (YjbR/CyaY superfamily)